MPLRQPLFSLVLLALLPLGGTAQQSQPAQKKVLFIGDSHSAGPMGAAVDEGLRQRYGPQVASYHVCSSTINWWANHERPPFGVCYYSRGFGEPATTAKTGNPPTPLPDIDVLMATNWDLVVIALGSNSDGASSDDTISAGMLMMTKLPKSSRCAWIGPPPMPATGNRVEEFYRVFPQILKLGGRTCQLIDSRQFVNALQSTNGGHYYGGAAAAWARGVLGAIAP
jgi:hypothetical protein